VFKISENKPLPCPPVSNKLPLSAYCAGGLFIKNANNAVITIDQENANKLICTCESFRANYK